MDAVLCKLHLKSCEMHVNMYTGITPTHFRYISCYAMFINLSAVLIFQFYSINLKAVYIVFPGSFSSRQ